jgi:hypothetical protein
VRAPLGGSFLLDPVLVTDRAGIEAATGEMAEGTIVVV